MPSDQNDAASQTTGQKPSWESRLREATDHVEQDLRKLVNHINDDLMPDIRRNGSSALRSAASELQRLAERMDEANGGDSSSRRPRP